MSKYVKTSQLKANHHVYPSGCQVIKAFTAKKIAFFDKSKCQLKVIGDSSFAFANSVRIMLCIQKNHQNSLTITLLSDSANLDLCPGIHLLRMVLRERRLNQPDSMLLRCYCKKKNPMVYMTANRIAMLIQEAIKKVCPGRNTKDLSKYSGHLLSGFGLASFWTKQARAPTTSASNFLS